MYIKFLYKLIIVTLFIIVSTSIIGQNKKKRETLSNRDISLKENFEDGLYFYDMGDYKEALLNFLRVWDAMPENANINFKVGMCYLNLPGEEVKAISYLESAVKRITTDYDKNSFTESKAPLYAYYYLGNAYLIGNMPDKALEMYNRFRNHSYTQKNYNLRMVEEQVEICERAKIIYSNPIPVTLENVSAPVNSTVNNYRPVVNDDQTMMIFITSMKFYEAIMFTQKIDGKWTEPINITEQLVSDGDCEPSFLTADGRELYLIKKVKNNLDIYVSTYDGSKWSVIKPLNKNINSSRNEASVCISRDGQVMYFSSDKRGGYGGYDIYKSEKNKNGDWGDPTNVGKIINTEKNENYPYLCYNDKILIFSSEGHLTMGGYDIFVSQYINKSWSQPVNIGYPINSTANDMPYYPIKDGTIAYTYLNRPDGLGQFDIYKILNPIFRFVATDEPHKQDSIRKLIVRDRYSKEIIGHIFTLPKISQQNTSNYTVE